MKMERFVISGSAAAAALLLFLFLRGTPAPKDGDQQTSQSSRAISRHGRPDDFGDSHATGVDSKPESRIKNLAAFLPQADAWPEIERRLRIARKNGDLSSPGEWLARLSAHAAFKEDPAVMENLATVAMALHSPQDSSAADWLLDRCPDDLLWALERSWLSEVPRNLIPSLAARLDDSSISRQKALAICRLLGSAATYEDQAAVDEFISTATSDEKEVFLSELRDETLVRQYIDTREDALDSAEATSGEDE